MLNKGWAILFLRAGGGEGLGNYQKKKGTAKVEKKNRAQWAKGKKSIEPFYS